MQQGPAPGPAPAAAAAAARVRLDDAEQAALARELFALAPASGTWPSPALLLDAEGVVLASTDAGGVHPTGAGRWPSPAQVRAQVAARRWTAPAGHLGWPPPGRGALDGPTLVLVPTAGTRPDDAAPAACARAWWALAAGRDDDLLLLPAPVSAEAPEVGVDVLLRACGAVPAPGGARAPAPARLTTGGLAVVLTGLSGSGKSTIAARLVELLVARGRSVTLLDGDEVRTHLSAGLGFSPAERDTNVRRIGWVAAQVVKHGGVAVCAPIAPYAATRAQVRALVEAQGGPGSFVLVHVATPLAECERRDRKGLYAAARRGEVADFTGISAPYEEPRDAELRLDTTDLGLEEAALAVLERALG